MIVLTTPTGNIGRKVLQQLLEQNVAKLRVIARQPDRLSESTRARLEVIQGDLHHASALAQALSGATALFWCQPDCPAATDYVGAYETLARKARDAIRSSEVPRVVAISAAGGTPARSAGPITALHRMESLLAESGAALRFLRCGSFFENLLWQWDAITKQGVFRYPMPGDVPGPQIATQDIATVAARLLLAADWQGIQPVPLPGPQDLSYAEMAAVLSRHLSRPVRYEAAAPAAYREWLVSLGQSPDAAQGLVDMFNHLAQDYRADAAANRSFTLTTFGVWLTQQQSGG